MHHLTYETIATELDRRRSLSLARYRALGSSLSPARPPDAGHTERRRVRTGADGRSATDRGRAVVAPVPVGCRG